MSRLEQYVQTDLQALKQVEIYGLDGGIPNLSLT